MKKPEMKINSLNGVFLDADFERLLHINLPTITVGARTYGELALIGDIHIGNVSLSKNVLAGYLAYLKKYPHIQIGLMGDLLECGELSPYIREEEIPKLDDQIAMFKGCFKPIANRIQFMLWGNHEERFAKASKSSRLMRDLALELGIETNVHVAIPQRGVYVDIQAGDKHYGAYFAHSKTNAKVNQDIQLERAGFHNLVSVNGFGHTHRLGWKCRTYRTLEMIDGQVYNLVRRQYLVSTGCFLKYPSYAEAASMPYTDVGCPFLKFHASEHQIEFYDLTGEYKDYLSKGGLPIPQPVETIQKHNLPTKPACPRCGSTDVQSRKPDWGCNNCGRRWKQRQS